MKKTIMIIFAITLFVTANSQTKSTSAKLLTKQDSINAFVQQRDAQIDTLSRKTSIRDFQIWLDENVSAKSLREDSMASLWTAFLNVKLEEWIRKNKIVVPRN